MALLPKKANTPENNEKATARTPFADGKHAFTITKSEFKATKAKTGHYLALFCKCFEGPEKGKVHFLNLNLDNPNPIAVEIAEKELNSICEAVGLVGVEDSVELHNLPFILELALDNSNPQYLGNKIIGFFPYNGAGQTIASGAVSTGPAPAWVPNAGGSMVSEPTSTVPPAQQAPPPQQALPPEAQNIPVPPVATPPQEAPQVTPPQAQPDPQVPTPPEPAAAKKLPWEK